MGYISEVAIIMTNNAFQKGKQWMVEHNVPDDDNMLIPQKGFPKIQLFKDTGSYLIKLDAVKWYHGNYGFPWIQHMVDFLESLDKDEFSFIRVGEEPGDVEYDGMNDDHYMYTQTTIEIESEENLIDVDPSKYYIHINLSTKDIIRLATLKINDESFNEWRDKWVAADLYDFFTKKRII